MARLNKIDVAGGIAWVEAPEVDLRVLCGCPADTVKHLMRRGLITGCEARGWSFETGPNAILLSDVMLQNGMFCNLAEFPVLQMLYRQGMILPDHPNNKGNRPLLIGLREQVEAQLHYIHRGNYGLLNRAELMAAGATPELADDLLAIKLQFAFGRIRHPKELLDTLYLGDDPVVVKGDVVVRRTGLNQFEFSLGNECVSVDLNLPEGQKYEPPYALQSCRVDRGYFSVIHSGEGDGWDAERPSMASIVMFQGQIYLVDVGPNVQFSLNALGIGVSEIAGLFHTHCHDDHFAGLTSLWRSDRRIKYYATPLVRASVTKKLSALLAIDESSFTDCFDCVDLELDRWTNINGLEVKPVLSPHPVETSIFFFRTLWEGGYRQYAHLADIVSLDLLAQMQIDPQEGGISRSFYEKVVVDYRTPVDIKKIDIGGGMIHGVAEDFRSDLSGRIVLAHTARPLTAAEREIGCDAAFGAVDVIIPGNHDYVWRSAYESLRSYFSDAPHHELRLLLNSPMVVLQPGTILLLEGARVTDVYLLVTGTVEMIDSDGRVSGMLTSGAMVGEVAGIEGSRAQTTYRAASFVQALKVSGRLFQEFVLRNGLGPDVIALEDRRRFLRSTWLCAEALSEVTLSHLAKDMPLLGWPAGQPIDPHGRLAFIKSGSAELAVGDEVIELLEPGDFFGEERAVFEQPAPFQVRATQTTEIYLVAPEVVREVPVMRWKLLETHEQRMRFCALEVSRRSRTPRRKVRKTIRA